MHRGNFEKIVNYKNWFERENVLNTCILQKQRKNSSFISQLQWQKDCFFKLAIIINAIKNFQESFNDFALKPKEGLSTP